MHEEVRSNSLLIFVAVCFVADLGQQLGFADALITHHAHLELVVLGQRTRLESRIRFPQHFL